MEKQEPTEFILDVFSDPRSVRDVVKGTFYLSLGLRVASMPRPLPAATTDTSQDTYITYPVGDGYTALRLPYAVPVSRR